ncbi:hypothetical protein ACFQMM_04240 [Saliphagus sp. GCM10025308]
MYEAADRLHELGFVDIQHTTPRYGVWTVTGREAVSSRIDEFVAEVGEQIVYLTVDELLTDDHLEALREAAGRGVEIYLAGISEAVEGRVREEVPSIELFETL